MEVPTFGPYRLGERLSASAAGEVFLAEDAGNGGAFILRVFPPAEPGDEERYDRVLHDARAASALKDPRVELTVDAGWIEKRAFLATLPLSGPTLADVVRTEGPLSPRDVARIGLDLADILARAHAHGVVHRALEPSCVHLAGAERAPRLSCFGLASLFESAPGVRDPERTPVTAYLAPEQIRGERADHRADSFALGAILWEALTGTPPSQPLETNRIPEDTPPLLPHLLLALLSPDPGARPAALSEEARALRELLATPEGPPPFAAAGAFERGPAEPPPLGRIRAALLVGAGALIVAAVRFLWRWRH